MKKKSFLKIIIPLLFLTCSLPACVPAALVACGAVAGGALVYDKRSIKTMAQDRDVASNVLKQINDDPELRKQTHITVASFNNLMLMTGQATTEDLRNRVYQIGSNAPGLKRIYNEITIELPIPASVQAKDSWITAKVKSAMLAEKGLNSTQIKVVTENNVVYLLGIVAHKQADFAAETASKISGVRKVVRIFEYE